MTVAMIAKIVFPPTEARPEQVTVRQVESVTIESSWELLTDTAVITMPRNVKFFEKRKVREVFRNGDPIEIWLGYDDDRNLIKEFTGYILNVSADIPITIKCEDKMYELKKHSVNYAMKTNKLQDLIKDIIPEGMNTDVADMELSKARFPNTTAAKVLEQLQESNIYSYFKGNQLVVGKIYTDDEEPPVVFNFSRNVVDNALQYKLKDDVLVLIKATSTLPKGKKVNVEFGDKGGVHQNLAYYNIASKDELLKLCKLDYEKFKKDGYQGDLNVFGTPSVRHGMKAKVLSDLYPDRDGTYWIKRVTKSFNNNGFRQALNLDQRSS
ncbi:MAG: hypothetical protein V7767_00655 [Leeuwenhoekiella sp.]